MLRPLILHEQKRMVVLGHKIPYFTVPGSSSLGSFILTKTWLAPNLLSKSHFIMISLSRTAKVNGSFFKKGKAGLIRFLKCSLVRGQ